MHLHVQKHYEAIGVVRLISCVQDSLSSGKDVHKDMVLFVVPAEGYSLLTVWTLFLIFKMYLLLVNLNSLNNTSGALLW